MALQRLQKVLAAQGVGSRRHIEKLIEAGDITVNGKTAHLGQQVSGNEIIKVAGKLIKLRADNSYDRKIIIYHKPVGEICTRDDPQERDCVFNHLPKPPFGRWVMVGRLDINTSGLLLFTNHGDWAHALMHPKHELERRYAVRVRGTVTPEVIDRLKTGVMLEDGLSRFHELQVRGGQGYNRWFTVSLYRGRQREVRRLWESQELQVSRLIRIGYAGITLPRDLRPGQYRELTEREFTGLSKIWQ